MKTIIAMDSFKGCLSSLDAGNTIKEAILSRYPSDSVEVFPLADGGEGTPRPPVGDAGGADPAACSRRAAGESPGRAGGREHPAPGQRAYAKVLL